MHLFRKYFAPLLALFYVASAGMSGCCDTGGACAALAQTGPACCCSGHAEGSCCCATEEGSGCSCVQDRDKAQPGEGISLLLPGQQKQKLAVHTLPLCGAAEVYCGIVYTLLGEGSPPGTTTPLPAADGTRGPPRLG